MTLEESVERELKAIECLIPFPCKTRLYINSLKHQIFNMRCCSNCKHLEAYAYLGDRYYACGLSECKDLSNWELADENN